jgi:hypothetical protein
VRPQVYKCHALVLALAMFLETVADAVIETLLDEDAADLEQGPDPALVANIALRSNRLRGMSSCKASVMFKNRLYKTDAELRNFSKLTTSRDRALCLINGGPRRWMHITRHPQHSHQTVWLISRRLFKFFLREQTHRPMDLRLLFRLQAQTKAHRSPTKHSEEPPRRSRSPSASSTHPSRRK